MADNENRIMKEIFEKCWEKTIPLTVSFELTYRCNLRCAHCYVVNHSPLEDELTTSQVNRILDELAGEKVFFLVLTGGEIFMRDDIFEIAYYARKKGFILRLFTNGTSITSKIADQIKEIYPQAVEISMYGANASTHENITRIPGSFEKSINSFQLLKERGITTVFKPTLMNQNFAEYDDMKRLAKELDAIPRFSIYITARNDGDTTPFQYRLTDDQIKEVYQQFTYDEIEPEKICIERKKGTPCGAGTITCSINPSGKVTPCVQLLVEMGDLKEQAFREIWWESKELLRLRNLYVSDLICKDCELLPYCKICIGQTLLEDGSLTGCCKESYRLSKIRKEVIQQKSSQGKVLNYDGEKD